jgi:Ca2+-binding RTX toxin-like protein
MTIDADVLSSGLSDALAKVIDDYEDGAAANAAEFGTDNLTDLDIDTDTATFLTTYTATHDTAWNNVYAAALTEDPTQPMQEAIRGFAEDVTANGLAAQEGYELVVNTALKDSVAVSGSIEDAFVAYVDGAPVGMYYEKATGNFILSTTTPSSTYYIPAGDYLAGAGKAVEAFAIYETFKDVVHDAYVATLGDEQAPFDAAKDYLIAGSTAIAGGALGGAFPEDPVFQAAMVGLGGALGGIAAQTLTSDTSAIIHDAKINSYTEAQTLALVEAHIKSVVNDQWSATGATATTILDNAEDLSLSMYGGVDGLAHGPDATYWPPAAPIPAPIEACLAPWATAPTEISPLVIDLSSGHTGVTLTTFNAATTTTFFDMTGDGFATQTAWTSGDTGILVRDLNSNGVIDNINEMFGSSTVDGFAKLAELDSNGDLKIDSHDADWSTLQVWVDANGDGVTQSGELHSLSSLGIASIDLSHVTGGGGATIDGNLISHTSSVTFTSGDTAAIDDAWFVNDPVNSYYNGSYTLDPDTLFLPDLRGYGTLPDLAIAMSQDATLKGMVEDYAGGFTMASFADPSTLSSDAANILYQWAGVESVDPSSRGQFVDARQLEFLEHLFGQDFSQRGAADPFFVAGEDITQSWNMVLENFKDDMLLQSGANSLFSSPLSYDPWTGTVTGTPALSETAVGDLVTNAPSAGPDNTAYWVEIAHFINTIEGIDNLTTDETSWLNSAIYSTDPTLAWSDIATLANDTGTTDPSNYIYGTSGDDSLTGTTVNDYISGSDGNDTIHGGAGNDTIYGDVGTDTLYGGDGNDTIHGGTGNDTLYGEAGNNTLYGDDGNDILIGGPGGNTVYGGAGDDTYVYTAGADNFYSEAYNGTGGTDQITLPSGIASGDLSFYRVSSDGVNYNDLLIKFSGGGSIQIQDQFLPAVDHYQIETLVFSNSSTLDLTSVTSPIVLLEDGNAVYSVSSATDNEIVYGGNGADQIITGSGNDVINGGSGNDILDGGTGNDTYVASPGFDTISDTGGTDVINIPTGYVLSDVTLLRHIGAHGPDSDLVIDIHGLDEIQITNQFLSSTYAIESLHFLGDSSTTNLTSQTLQTIGTSGNDSLSGLTSGVGGNWFDGRGGNDSISNGIGNNTYVFEIGFGTDTISSTYHAGTNVLDFEGVDPENIRMWTTSNGSLHIQDVTDTTHSITVSAATTGSGNAETAISSYLQQINFDDIGSTVWNLAEGLTLTNVTSGGSLYGSAHDDTLYGDSLSGVLYGNSGNDTLIVGTGADTLNGGLGNDTYVFAPGFVSSTINESLSSGTDAIHFSGIDPSDIRMWTDSSGSLHLQDLADTSHNITVSAGTTGSNHDESTIGNYVESVTFDGAYSTTWDLTSGLTLTNVTNGGSLYGTAHDDILIGGSIGGTLYGNAGNDTFEVGSGVDTLNGGPGSDTYVFTTGFASSTISESTGQGTDTIHFTGINPANIRMWTDTGGNLHLQDITDTAHNITVSAGTTGSNHDESTIGNYVESVTFDSGYGTTWDLTGGLALSNSSSGGNLYGTAYGDTLNGGSGSDTIYGNAGNDVLYGGGGSSDLLTGGPGADTFFFKAATAFSSPVTIADYNAGDGDNIDIHDVLTGHYDPLTQAIADFVTLTTSGSNTLLKIDLDGTGGSYSPTTIATISGVTGLSLSEMITDHHLIVPS